jgi:hypothetical protein
MGYFPVIKADLDGVHIGETYKNKVHAGRGTQFGQLNFLNLGSNRSLNIDHFP